MSEHVGHTVRHHAQRSASTTRFRSRGRAVLDESIVAAVTADEPWERQPGESEAAWVAFRLYRDLPRRSLRSLAVSLAAQQSRNESTTFRQVGEWSRVWRWQDRCRAYDNANDREKREAMLRQHVSQLQSARQALAMPITVMVEMLRADPLLPRTLATQFLADLHSGRSALASYERLMTLIVRTSQAAAMLIPAERISHGLSATNVAVGPREDAFDGEIARRTLGDVDDETAALVRAVLLRAHHRSSE